MPRVGLTPDAVVDAAMDVVDRDGGDQLTLAAVADHVGVRSPSLYRHVDSLDDLRQRLAVRALRELAAALERAVGQRHGADALRTMMVAYRQWANANPERYALVPVAAPEPGTPAAAASDELVGTVVQWVAGFGLEGDDAVHAVRTVRSALHGFSSIDAAGGFGLPVAVDASFAHLVDLLVAGLAAQSGGEA